ncbi:BtpA/SgcQ family protein [Actinotalea fermentans]|uniref:Sgc region protein SgcQ n=1 Tax=Actinotalea fermentans TaxID=43671 RepID=A0A511YX84_9CELL|nr:BtpA/SgcQ family protein [Actinotalea fermentans]KGM16932.1 SgcQ protein [Actinotalea fermentans ATCC 43279 = JCM 9966 = DSM 3133]GEN79808.1 sgc region protein SgcQ [Actinotalea fermentans]
MNTWLDEVFDVKKPIIGMCHLPALPGDPGYDAAGGMTAVLEHGRREITALQEGGVDGILISNEFSLPYLTNTEPVTAVTMARVIGELRSELSVPFGVNVLWDGVASIDLAVATGASFVREVFTGVYASDFGMWNTDVGRAARHRARMGASGVRLLYNIVPEAAAYLGGRELAQMTRSTVFNGAPDGLCVSGLTAGAATDTSTLKVVKENAGAVPVFVNTGVRPDTVAESLQYADAAIVGTWFKKDGKFENDVEAARVADLMSVVRGVRA